MQEPVKKKFYNVSEYAELVGDSIQTVYRDIRAGLIPHIQHGPRKKIWIPAEVLDGHSGNSAPLNNVQDKTSIAKNSVESFSGPEPDWLG